MRGHTRIDATCALHENFEPSACVGVIHVGSSCGQPGEENSNIAANLSRLRGKARRKDNKFARNRGVGAEFSRHPPHNRKE